MLVRPKTYPEGLGSQQSFSSLVFDTHDQLVLVIVSRYVEERKVRVEALVTGNTVTLLPFALVHMYDTSCSLHLKNKKLDKFVVLPCLPCRVALGCKGIDLLHHFEIFACLEKW